MAGRNARRMAGRIATAGPAAKTAAKTAAGTVAETVLETVLETVARMQVRSPALTPAPALALALALGVFAAPGIGRAQQGPPAQRPLSAIDWLSDSLSVPPPGPDGTDTGAGTGAGAGTGTGGHGGHGGHDGTGSTHDAGPARAALPAEVETSPIGAASPDGIGLLPVSVSGFSRNLWGQSRTADIVQRLRRQRATDMYPAVRGLYYRLLLAELDPPADAGAQGRLLLARIDALLELGALQQARALLSLSGTANPELFRRAFDIALLLGTEDEQCAVLRNTPRLSPTFPARVFCLARGGDWQAASLSLETGRALGFIDDAEARLLERFLDPALAEDQPRLPPPETPSPLVFRLFEAIGEPMPTTGLPLAFAWADLDANTGWRARIEAAERLSRTGAVDANLLLGLYEKRKPAASGGVWERLRAVQALSQALDDYDARAVSDALVRAWALMKDAELEIPFANMFGHRLSAVSLTGAAADLAFEVGMLGPEYRHVARRFSPHDERQRFLVAVALGRLGDTALRDPFQEAIRKGFRAEGVPVRLQSLVDSGRGGEALLRALSLFTDGANGDLAKLTDAIAYLRAAGLDDTARRAAIEVVILARRG